MAEYIDREAAIKEIYRFDGYIDDDMEWKLHYALKKLPAADVVEVRYCRFSLEEARRRGSVYKCSACGNYLTVRADTLNGGRADMNYCPFCGRKVMHKGQDEAPAGPYDLLYEEGGENLR